MPTNQLYTPSAFIERGNAGELIYYCSSPRKRLPVQMISRNDFNIWSVLKNCIGKELSKITMPVVFNEPLSFLQRISEIMEYSKLLRIAAHQSDPVDRLKYVTAFVLSSLSSNWDRLGKPFNPLLGETYEIERDDFRMVAEQVSTRRRHWEEQKLGKQNI